MSVDRRVGVKMRRTEQRPLELETWMLFAFPAVITTVIISGFLVGGPIVGFPAAILVVAAIVTAAIKMEPRGGDEDVARTGFDAAPDADRGWRRSAAKRFLVPLAIAVIGIVVILASEGTARAVGWGVLAIAITVAISLVFLEIGYSEDRARAREQRRPRRRRER